MEGEEIELTWPKEMILLEQLPNDDERMNSASFTVDIQVYKLGVDSDNMSSWVESTMLLTNCQNDGVQKVNIPQISRDDFVPIIFHVSLSEDNINAQQLSQDLIRSLASQKVRPRLWTGVAYYRPDKIQTSSSFDSLCTTWYSRADNISLDSLEPCPPTLAQARTPNSGFEEELFTSLIASTSYDSLWREFFHPDKLNISTCFIESRFVVTDSPTCIYLVPTM